MRLILFLKNNLPKMILTVNVYMIYQVNQVWHNRRNEDRARVHEVTVSIPGLNCALTQMQILNHLTVVSVTYT
jgi:hypothetical protein